MIEYRTVEIHTLAGLKQAERLQAAGWKIERNGMFTMLFSREKKRRVRAMTPQEIDRCFAQGDSISKI